MSSVMEAPQLPAHAVERDDVHRSFGAVHPVDGLA
jgi:hypothetical protein